MGQVSKDIRTILIVEDYDDVRHMLRILLESENYGVLEASTGAEALKILKSARPDVILMDLALPGIDGFETIRRIRRIDGFQNTPIIILSAYSGRAVYETARRAGTDLVKTKPIDFDELAELLNEIFEAGPTGNSKALRSGAQRAMVTSRVPMTRTVIREIRLTI